MVLLTSVKGKSKRYPAEWDGDFSEKFSMEVREKKGAKQSTTVWFK